MDLMLDVFEACAALFCFGVPLLNVYRLLWLIGKNQNKKTDYIKLVS